MDLNNALILARGIKGDAAANLVKIAIASPQIFFFKELCQCDSIRDLQVTHPKYWDTLRFFSYGRIKDYDANKLLPLTPESRHKLSILTLVSACKGKRIVEYATLMDQVQVDSVPRLEELIIAAFALGLLDGRLDQKRACLIVLVSKSRDVDHDEIPGLFNALDKWDKHLSRLAQVLQAKTAQVQARLMAREMSERDYADNIEQAKKKLPQREGFSLGPSAAGKKGMGKRSRAQPGPGVSNMRRR